MKRASLFRVLAGLFLCGAVAAGCGNKDEEPATVPVPSSDPTPVAAEPPPATTATDDPNAGGAAASGTPAATAPAQPASPGTATAATPAKQESIDACCSALRAVAKSGKSATAKAKAASAAAVCPGIAKLVKQGTTSRSAGLSQIRSALAGYDVPGECR